MDGLVRNNISVEIMYIIYINGITYYVTFEKHTIFCIAYIVLFDQSIVS